MRKNFLLFSLIICMLLPLFSSMVVVCGVYDFNGKNSLISMIEKEESSKEEENSSEKEKEKDYSLVSYYFSCATLLFEVELQFISDDKIISGMSDLHIPPPKNS
jgi:hypothetical protein